MPSGPIVQVQSWGDAVFASISNTIYTLLGALPQIIGALIILIIGWLISNLVARLTRVALERSGADGVFVTHGADVYGNVPRQFRPSIVGAEIVRWVIRFVFLIAAANTLGLNQITQLLNQVILWIPNLVVAAIILLVAPILARFVRGTIEVGAGRMGFTNANILGRVAEVAIIAMAVIVAIDQIGIAPTLVNALFIAVVGALALAFGLAFGLGGRDVAARITQEWYESSQSAAQRVRDQAEQSNQPMAPSRAQRTRPASGAAYAAMERNEPEESGY
jgi:hypothetical protein